MAERKLRAGFEFGLNLTNLLGAFKPPNTVNYLENLMCYIRFGHGFY